MEPAHATLFFMCGKMAAGKSTLAQALALQHGAILISEDQWLATLYPDEITGLPDYLKYAQRLKTALAAHVCALLQHGLSVVLDFPANTRNQRTWFRHLIEASGATHQLHHVDVPDTLCKQQLSARNARAEAAAAMQDEVSFELLSRYFLAPQADEGFMVVHHPRT